MLGWIPWFLSEIDPRPARKQFDSNYAHGGGWRTLDGWTVLRGGKKIYYPGDPAYQLLAEATLRDEIIRVYENAWVSITQPDGRVEIARMD